MSKLKPYHIIVVCLACAGLLAGLIAGATAHADGGYLHMKEANALARNVAKKTNGVVHVSPCVRTGPRTASCVMRQDFKLNHVTCGYVVHVSKRYTGKRFYWKAAAGKADCEYVG